MVYEYDQEYIDSKYEFLDLKIIHRRRCTGFEETKDFRVRINDLIAGRYQVNPTRPTLPSHDMGMGWLPACFVAASSWLKSRVHGWLLVWMYVHSRVGGCR